MDEDIPKHQRGPSRKRRAPKVMTPARLERIALHHLDRYPSSIENLRRVLERRAEKSRLFHEGEPSEHSEWIEAVLQRLTELGHLDDDAYGAAVARRLRDRGSSARLITARLSAKGLSFDRVQNILGD
ncbi:RecX family transcriptional regulator, partial [Myxococcota bacterium]|nr:RecX family transcriptional regulator [Myxococcota bacterium]